jgi:hypothetical protein
MDRYVEEETQLKADYIRDFVIGAIAITIGGGITAATYASADPGGTYLVFWGPVLYGGYRVVVGLVKWLGSLAR